MRIRKFNKNKSRAMPSRSILTEQPRQKVRAPKLPKFNKTKTRIRSSSRPKRECASHRRKAHPRATTSNRLACRPSIPRKATTALPKPKLVKLLAMRVTDQRRRRLSLNLTPYHKYSKSKMLPRSSKQIQLRKSQSP